MKRSITTHMTSLLTKGLMPALLAAAILSPGATTLQAGQVPTVVPPYPNVYGALSAAWWQWAMSQPLAGHPFNDDPAFNVAAGQLGPVWFLATPFGIVDRYVTVPAGKFLLVGLMNAEGSSLEGMGTTYTEQRAAATFQADHIQYVSCSIDGVAVPNIDAYRFVSPQFHFCAPSPWIFGLTGGNGTAVADGYFVMAGPFLKGTHAINIKGAFHFSVAEGDPFDFDGSADVTYHITVK
jgi:hypothetical protein